MTHQKLPRCHVPPKFNGSLRICYFCRFGFTKFRMGYAFVLVADFIFFYFFFLCLIGSCRLVVFWRNYKKWGKNGNYKTGDQFMICPLIYYFYLCIDWLIFFVLDNLIVIKEEGCFEFSLKIPKDANWMTRLLAYWLIYVIMHKC